MNLIIQKIELEMERKRQEQKIKDAQEEQKRIEKDRIREYQRILEQ